MAIRVGRRLSLRWMMVGVAVAAGLMGGWVAWSRRETGPPISALVWVSIPESVLGPRDVPDWQARLALEIKTQRELIKSPSTLAAVVASSKPGPGSVPAGVEDPIEWLERHLSVEVVPDTAFIQIKMSGASRQDQAALINAVADKYLKVYALFEVRRHHEALEAAERLDAKYRQYLLDARRRLREAAASGISPEEVEELRDGIAVAEQVGRRARLAVEERRAEVTRPPSVELIDQARP